MSLGREVVNQFEIVVSLILGPEMTSFFYGIVQLLAFGLPGLVFGVSSPAANLSVSKPSHKDLVDLRC